MKMDDDDDVKKWWRSVLCLCVVMRNSGAVGKNRLIFRHETFVALSEKTQVFAIIVGYSRDISRCG